MKAIIIGATGAIGKKLVQNLIQDDNFTEIVLFVRRDPGISHPKIITEITSFENLENFSKKIV